MPIDETKPADTDLKSALPALLRGIWAQLNGSYIEGQFVFPVPGSISVGTDASIRIPVRASKGLTILDVKAYVKVAPTGSSIIVDVNKNDTTIFTTQANRPTIAVGAYSSSATVPDVTALSADDILTIDIDQEDSGKAAMNLTLSIRFKQLLVIP